MVNSGLSMVSFPFAAQQLFGSHITLTMGAYAMLSREEIRLKFI